MKTQERHGQGALLALSRERVALGLGPFQAKAAPDPDRPAFFAPDFFLEDPAPWKHPARFRIAPPEEILEHLPPLPEIDLSWSPPCREAYGETFRDLKTRIEKGLLEKAVPLVFQEAPLPPESPSFLPGLVRRALQAGTSGRAFAFWEEEGGILGVSPEVLFRIGADGLVRTMALAGTRPLEQAEELLQDPKEHKEHDLVAEFLEQTLASLGKVRRGPIRLARLATLAHLETPFTLEPSRPLDFQDLVEALHPTPALGGTPRKEAWKWLKEKDRHQRRGRFGAPFGLRLPGGESLCLVAIRCLQWEKERARIGSGSGVVAQSTLEREWKELEKKREALRWMLGI